MKFLFESFRSHTVGHYQSLLEVEGIDAFLKKEHGEAPCPQLWIRRNADYDWALEILEPHYREHLENLKESSGPVSR